MLLDQIGKYVVQNATEQELVFYVEEAAIEFRLKSGEEEAFNIVQESVTVRINRKGMMGFTSYRTRLAKVTLQHMHYYTVTAPSGVADDGIECKSIS